MFNRVQQLLRLVRVNFPIKPSVSHLRDGVVGDQLIGKWIVNRVPLPNVESIINSP
jgi:hypothetical protein